MRDIITTIQTNSNSILAIGGWLFALVMYFLKQTTNNNDKMKRIEAHNLTLKIMAEFTEKINRVDSRLSNIEGRLGL